MHSVGSIATNTSEDYIDELASGVVYKYKDYVFSGFDKTKLTSDDSDVMDEALNGAYQTLQFSIMNSVILVVSEYAMSRVIAGSTFIFGYIKGHRVVNNLKKAGRKVYKGNSGAKLVKKGVKVLFGTQEERLAMSSMANSNMNNLTTVLSQERQTQTTMKSSKRKQMLDTLGLSSNDKELRDTKKLQSYNYKMKSGTWENTVIDKNLFLSCVPKEYVKQPFMFNTAFVTTLNKFKEFATSAEGNLVNLAQTHVDLMTSHNISKVN